MARRASVVVFGALLAACTSGSFSPPTDTLAPPNATVRQAVGAAPLLDLAITRHTATLLADGSVLVAGGLALPSDDSVPTPRKNAWRYVSAEAGFETLPDLTTARSGHTATRLLDGTVFIAGGFDAAGAALDATELYDPSSAAFIGGPALPSSRGDGTATLLKDGRVLLVGGYSDANHARSSAAIELYDPLRQTFTPVADPNHHSGANVALSLADGKIGIRWGVESDEPRSALFDPGTNQLTTPTLPLFGELPRESVVAATRLPSGPIAVFDGWSFRLTDPSTQCSFGRGTCHGSCTDFTSDENCGACDSACPSGTTCDAGTCICVNGDSYCDGSCHDVLTDHSHCGSCDKACAASELCVNGECQADCGGYLTRCGDSCVDTQYDAQNCHRCGQSCGEGSGWRCDEPCVCGGGATHCDSTCTFVQTDPEHCGGCENHCADDETCANGVCTRTACSPLVSCGDECTSLLFDTKNCGQCGTECSSSQFCSGSCQACPAGYVACAAEQSFDGVGTVRGRECSNLQDALHCGACPNACPSGICQSGSCVPPCPEGQASCDGQCRSITTEFDCGACNRQCHTGLRCVSGTCVFGSTEPTAPPLVPSLAAGSLWTTEGSTALGLEAYALALPDSGTDGITAMIASEEQPFGGPGHTTTTLADGSLLTIGGSGTPRARRLYPEWTNHGGYDLGHPFYAGAQATTTTTLTLADGRLLLVWGTGLYQYAGLELAPFDRVLPPGAIMLGAALQPSGSVLLLLRNAPGALLFDPGEDTLKNLDVTFKLASTSSGRALPLRGGDIVIAGPEGVELVSAAGSGKKLEVRSLALDVGCDQPALSRLANGHVLVLGTDVLYELDVNSARKVGSADLLFPRCRGSIVQRRDGSVLLVGGVDEKGVASTFTELYEPPDQSVRRSVSSAGVVPDRATAHNWFDEPLLLGGSPGAAFVDWQDGTIAVANFWYPPGVPDATRLTAGGSWFSLQASDYLYTQLAQRGAFREMTFDFPQAPTLHMGENVDFESTFPGHPYPGNAPEGSSGTTQSSATNLPIPVWFPAEDGWPSVGTLTKSTDKATYHVPSTPFPGFGLMFLSANGELTPLGPVTIAPSESGAECGAAGECDSGFCVDGVCCDQACDGKCEACSRAKKGGGNDGECKPVVAGTPDDACDDNLRDCGENGSCDAEGKCALYPDGSKCATDAVCRDQSCVLVPNTPPSNGEAGSTGSGGTGGTGGTKSDSPAPRNTCNSDEQLVSPDGTPLRECTPYRCRDAACVSRCESTRDCADGYACDPKGNCVTPVAHRAEPIGCGCRVPNRRATSAWSLMSLLLASGSLLRRRAFRPREFRKNRQILRLSRLANEKKGSMG